MTARWTYALFKQLDWLAVEGPAGAYSQMKQPAASCSLQLPVRTRLHAMPADGCAGLGRQCTGKLE